MSFPKEALLNLLYQLKQSTPGGTGKLSLWYHLSKNDPAAAEADLTLASFTEADFPGYAALNIGNATPFINGAGEGEIDGHTLTWTAGAIVTPQTCYWLYCTFINTNGDHKLLFVGKFDAPITLGGPGEKIKKSVNFFARNFTP